MSYGQDGDAQNELFAGNDDGYNAGEVRMTQSDIGAEN
jgi:hypothetical protein